MRPWSTKRFRKLRVYLSKPLSDAILLRSSFFFSSLMVGLDKKFLISCRGRKRKRGDRGVSHWNGVRETIERVCTKMKGSFYGQIL